MEKIILSICAIALVCTLSSCYIPITNGNDENEINTENAKTASVEVYYIDITNVDLPASYCLEVGETFYLHVKANGYGDPVPQRDFVVYADGDSDCFDIQYVNEENGRYIYRVECIKTGAATIYAEATIGGEITSRLIVDASPAFDENIDEYHLDKSTRTYHKKDCEKYALVPLEDREWVWYELNDAYYHPCEECIGR